MTAAELAREVEELQARLRSAKRALKTLQGQQRAAIQLLAGLDDEFVSLRGRLERTAEEAQDHEHDDRFSGAAVFA